MKDLFSAIKEAEQISDEIKDYCKVICKVSKNYFATDALLEELVYAVITKERKWAEIELREDFKKEFANREDAKNVFLSNIRKKKYHF